MSQTLRLGAFIIATLTILGVGVFLIGNRQSRFESTYTLRAQFQNVAGLIEGADVRVGGIRKGAVRHIQLPDRPDGKVTVIMSLASETLDIVKQDSLAEIKSEGLLGDKHVEVSFGSQNAARLRDGETIASAPPLDISNLIAKADQILDTTTEAMMNFRGAAGNIDTITTKINAGTGTAGALVNDKALYQQAAASVTALREDAEALKHNFFLRGFFKDRGYESASELAKNEIARLPEIPFQREFILDSKQLFDKPDSTKLKNPKRLRDLLRYLETENAGTVIVTSSTGPRGDAGHNRELTQARAYVIRKYLAENSSVDDQRIRTIGLGEVEEQGDRVRVLVYPPGVQVVAHTEPPFRNK